MGSSLVLDRKAVQRSLWRDKKSRLIPQPKSPRKITGHAIEEGSGAPRVCKNVHIRGGIPCCTERGDDRLWVPTKLPVILPRICIPAVFHGLKSPALSTNAPPGGEERIAITRICDLNQRPGLRWGQLALKDGSILVHIARRVHGVDAVSRRVTNRGIHVAGEKIAGDSQCSVPGHDNFVNDGLNCEAVAPVRWGEGETTGVGIRNFCDHRVSPALLEVIV
mmetsp:Transcript_13701/g.59808  ORF Transcript_13701/g.59808 Transcript_13701/m.59808 type:complete len:221 (+) Transcript_13701:7735-8397(+)